MDAIFVYWARRTGLEVADSILDTLEEKFPLLGEFPAAGRPCNEIGPGILRVPAGKYLIYYRKKKGTIHILHVLHGARDQASALGMD